MAGVEVRRVESRAEMKAFIDLAWSIYQGDSNWVPPIKAHLAKLLTPGQHPFWKNAERELFLAWRGMEPVGRIAAIIDSNYNSYHQEKMGAWGFFESMRHPEVAVALFAAAESWLKARGMEFLRGPLNPSIFYEAGMLIHGFDSPPTLMMTYNPPYYPELVRFSGFRKEKDLFSFYLTRDYQLPDWALPLAERLAAKAEVTVRHMEVRNFEAEVRLATDIFNDCWAQNWGFTPLTFEELRDTFKDILPLLDTELTFFLYYQDDPAGICVLIPDINPLLKRFNGKLGLSALIKKHLYWSEVTGLRGLILGVKEKYRQMGLPLVTLHYLMKKLIKKSQYHYLELGWNLEDNEAINRLYEEGGLQPRKRFRVYRKEIK